MSDYEYNNDYGYNNNVVTDLLDPQGRVDDTPNDPLPFPRGNNNIAHQSSDALLSVNLGMGHPSSGGLSPRSRSSIQAAEYNKGVHASNPPGSSADEISKRLGEPKPVENRILKPMHQRHENEHRKIGTERDRVKYYNGSGREAKYRIEINATLKRRGMVFDTPELKALSKASLEGKKSEGQFRPYAISFATLGKSPDGTRFSYPDDWNKGAMIWVCIPDANNQAAIYSGVGKGGRFHHSSLADGKEVIGAGEWIVRRGKLLKISANSGHYRPTMNMLYHSVLHMSRAFNEMTEIFMFDSHELQWVYRPVLEFIRRPSKDGRFWVHPDSPA